MSAREDILRVLTGGIPALIETPPQTTQQATNRPETVAPEPTNRDLEPLLMNVTSAQVLWVTAAIIGLLGVIYLAKKF